VCGALIHTVTCVGTGNTSSANVTEEKHQGVQADQRRTVNHQRVLSMKMSNDILGCTKQRNPQRDREILMPLCKALMFFYREYGMTDLVTQGQKR